MTQDIKNAATKHGVPIMVVIAMDPKTGFISFAAIGDTASNHTVARRIADNLQNIFKTSGLFR